MRKWILKAVVQKTISLLPGRRRLNYLFQKYVTRGVQLTDAYFQDRLIHLGHHLKACRYSGGEPAGIRVLELGTGWYPVIPVGFFLAGAEEVCTVDVSSLMDREKVLTTLSQYRKARKDGTLAGFLDPSESRWSILEAILDRPGDHSFDEILRSLNLTYLVTDARQLPLPGQSIDLITSNNTFEHIYPEVLEAILSEFLRVVRPGGIMSHFIDMSDHFAHLDKSITVYHFLRFSGRTWEMIDNTIQPQNRLRISHYREMYRRLGIPITREENRPGDPDLLRQEPIADEFAHIPWQDLAVTHSYLTSAMGSMDT